MAEKRYGEVWSVSSAELQRALRKGVGGDERRKARRVPMKLAVELRVSRGELSKIYTENISDGGLLFSVAAPVSLPGTVDLTLQLPDGRSVELSGDVRHVETKQGRCYVGVQFTSISDEVRRSFEDALMTTN
jgi:c-di-GMP-binding flagellar brake protein YcgR